MYTIEYYKDGHESKRVHQGLEEYANIKSLTIDLSDIYEINIHNLDYSTKHLISLASSVRRLGLNDREEIDRVDKIRILNNNFTNTIYISEIINCKWMINEDDFHLSEEAIFSMIKDLNRYVKRYENSTTDYEKSINKRKIQKRLKSFKRYINTTKPDENKEPTNHKVLKLGTNSFFYSKEK